ncbi:amidase [Hyphomonas sp.]|uniref:amidase n=1 Tax=Hyphomonas sp. TaxID=87 RepID=UPI003528CA85
MSSAACRLGSPLEREGVFGMRILVTASLMALVLGGCGGPPEPAAQEELAVIPSYEATGIVAKTLPELADDLAAGTITSEELTQAYLDRIALLDRDGPRLQSIISLNPNALPLARASDQRRKNGEALGPLDGVPVLLKDNIESLDPMPTTAGSLALKDNITGRDSPLVSGLRAQGAIILGKTNLSQWANFRDNDSMSGWSSIGGQVRNPHMLDRNPCGSSSGSGVAVAASLAAGAVGTETNGSIICPSNVNGIVGFKPTVGLISQEGIVPISPSQDTAGPMTRTVRGAAMMMNAMDPGDEDYTIGLSADSLKGMRIGVLHFAEGSNKDIKEKFTAALAVMEAQGATLVDIDAFEPAAENFWDSTLPLLEFEFKDSLNAYLATTPETVTTKSLRELIAFNEVHADEEMPLFGQSLFIDSEARGPLTDPEYLGAKAAVRFSTREQGIDRLLADYDVNLLVSPSGPISPRIDPVNGDVWPEWAGAGWLAAQAGYPHLTVPMGNVHGIPVGISFIGSAGDDAAIIAYGYAYEQATQLRPDPHYLTSAEERPEISTALTK